MTPTGARLSAPDVERLVLAERPGTGGSWPWTLELIAQATTQFGESSWREVQIDGPAALSVVLPSHAGEPCRGDQLLLVPEAGASVLDTAAILDGLADEYARLNPSCWGRISAAADEPFSTLVLVTGPLEAEAIGDSSTAPTPCIIWMDSIDWSVGRGPESSVQGLGSGRWWRVPCPGQLWPIDDARYGRTRASALNPQEPPGGRTVRPLLS